MITLRRSCRKIHTRLSSALPTSVMASEFDVHLTKDDIPVVFHDDTLSRMCGVKGNLRDYTYEELQQFRLLGTQERIPAFADILKMVDGRVPLIIEYKVEKMQTSCAASATRFWQITKGCTVSNPFIRLPCAGIRHTAQTLSGAALGGLHPPEAQYSLLSAVAPHWKLLRFTGLYRLQLQAPQRGFPEPSAASSTGA